jgi:hypothetical protein
MNDFNLYAKITKIDPELRVVEGYASTEALDAQGEIVTRDAIKMALPDYMKFGNVREMHQPKAAGKTKSATIDDKGMYISVKVVADDAWKLVKEGVYSGFSIGGRMKSKVKNKITGLDLVEISLVDRPANPEAVFTMFKVDDSGAISDFNNKTMKKEEVIIKEDEVKEEVVEEAVEGVETIEVEEVVEEPVEKKKKEEVKEEEVVEVEEEVKEEEVEQPEVVVDEVKETADKSDEILKSVLALSEKLDALVEKVEALPKQEEVTKVAVVDATIQKSKPVASYLVEKVADTESKESQDLKVELGKIQKEIDSYKSQGLNVPIELTDRGYEILSKLN